jgi:mannose-6-phosphate isomerase-like protein (cupin superfamily)
MIAKSRESYRAYRITPQDTNRLVPVFDPIGEKANFLFAIEIFDVGGKTPPNVHRQAQEMFLVLHGEGRADCGGTQTMLKAGDSMLLMPGTTHVVENTGKDRLYCMTVMVPNEDFAELIRTGIPEELDDGDWAIISGKLPG